MPQNNTKKIGLIVDSLSSGGAEKSAAILSVILEDVGYKVVIVAIKPEASYTFKGELIHLGKAVSNIKCIKQLQKILRFRKTIKANPNTIWIDYRMRNRKAMEFLLHGLVFKNEKLILTVHHYHIDYHIPKGNYFNQLYKKHTITSVSKAIKERLLKDKGLNSTYIPNAINFEAVSNKANEFSVNEDYIVAVGRLNNAVKQFDVLIEAYAKSVLKTHQIKLFILGDGEDKFSLQKQITDLKLEDDVKLLGFMGNPYPYIKHAKYLVLTSKFEGLPMVILEALNLRTPVVSYDCPSGPSEMILHGENGLLIENQNFDALVDTMNELILNPDKLNHLAEKSHDYLLPYNTKSHLNYWETLFKTL
jgi:glycosyltransferase involved in cell wall biosynthesis